MLLIRSIFLCSQYFNDTNDDDQQMDQRLEIEFLCSSRIPDEVDAVPKHVTCHELYFMICILLHFTQCICWLI